MTPDLLTKFASPITALSKAELDDPRLAPSLRMERVTVGGRNVEMIYAPFDHVNRAAKVMIVGMTPGRTQATNALRVAKEGLLASHPLELVSREAKVFASFSGEPMRTNLIRMLDLVGVARFLSLASCGELWSSRSDLVHFTSALRYPVFVDGLNWSGQPDMVRNQNLRSWLETYTGSELALLEDALIVPLGPKVTAAMTHLATLGLVKHTHVLSGLPHPSGANSERISYFLGDKPAHLCSTKTNPETLDIARAALIDRIECLRT
ncbi:MAG TPA: hypothetical protein VGM26_09760 [Rhizomicrobium sp.]|jgi:hypothetical protein